MRIIVVGAGGHGQVVADALLAEANRGRADHELAGFVDDDPSLLGRRLCDAPVLGTTADLCRLSHDGVIVAIGDNRVRRAVSASMVAGGEILVAVVHPAAVVARGVDLGPGTAVLAGAVINTGAHIGAGVILNTCSSVDHHSVVHDFVHVAPGAHAGGEVVLGEGCLIGLGAGVLPRRTVGAWAVVGGGATVTRDVEPGITVIGLPARPLSRTRPQE
jgi:sugar O-acyltransferase (sialic acid O-acetyltransferase NeuD family)